ncbi:MAG: undecaprenyl/decaprenyl-phosphate alpha-N-acetylglucosaminyl 1-phosphate transferase [Bacteroidales bacterium]|nr:undecaprenyl/decaprenyl-phosphate alpha-N-acetylglucosaminyl 1-phosphate transferase [Bacteroidales bacterium]
MSINLLYGFAFLIPFMIMPMVLPMVVLMAQRKKLTDSPNARKFQSMPVAVMGGMVIILLISISFLVMNVFYDLTTLLPAFCVMTILFVFGMLDDIILLSWQFKLILQVFSVLLLFFGGNYGLNSLFGLFGIYTLPLGVALVLTLFIGIMLLNAVNFVDGIDGLASGLGILVAFVMGYWNSRHGFVAQAITSYTMVGVMSSFFIFNVFSQRYKMYMGDSGSLVLGLFIYCSACPDPFGSAMGGFLADNYFISFMLSLLSAMVFDLVRVALVRVLKRKSPFHPDRSHLHHVFVDAGMSHFLATVLIMLLNSLVILVWYITSSAGMQVGLQFFVVIAAGIVFLWMPYFLIANARDKRSRRYTVFSIRCVRVSKKIDIFYYFMRRLIDGRRRTT